MPIPTLPGIMVETVTTPRITTRVLTSGFPDAIPVIFVHGNASSATFWEEMMLALPVGFRGVAPDLRGYGDADRSAKIDATRGLADISDDLAALMEKLSIEQAHFIAHSLGGSVMWQFLMDYPQRVLTATLAAPGSPYGFGGTKDVDGTPTYADFAGSGGGVVNPEFAKRMGEGDRSTDSPVSPRNVLNGFYWKPPFKATREEELLSSVMSEHIGDKEYPGDLTPSTNWPNVAPGVWGPANALSPKYIGDVSRLFSISPKPTILWVHGKDDQIISDTSLFDVGFLGSLGAIPGWPGAEVHPPQPMVSQIRAYLEKYKAAGGNYLELELPDTGHSPFIERPAEFNAAFHKLIQGQG